MIIPMTIYKKEDVEVVTLNELQLFLESHLEELSRYLLVEKGVEKKRLEGEMRYIKQFLLCLSSKEGYFRIDTSKINRCCDCQKDHKKEKEKCECGSLCFTKEEIEKDEWVVIEAEEGEEFQEYVYDTGEKVPAGTPVGIENPKKNEFKLLRGINYSNR